MSTLHGLLYVNSFKKNCPKVRMIIDEEKEMERLIDVAIDEGVKHGKEITIRDFERKKS